APPSQLHVGYCRIGDEDKTGILQDSFILIAVLIVDNMAMLQQAILEALVITVDEKTHLIPEFTEATRKCLHVIHMCRIEVQRRDNYSSQEASLLSKSSPPAKPHLQSVLTLTCPVIHRPSSCQIPPNSDLH